MPGKATLHTGIPHWSPSVLSQSFLDYGLCLRPLCPPIPLFTGGGCPCHWIHSWQSYFPLCELPLGRKYTSCRRGTGG